MQSLGEHLYLCFMARQYGLNIRALNIIGYRRHQGHSLGGNKPAKDEKLSSPGKRRFLSALNKAFTCFIITSGFLVWLPLPILILALLPEGAGLSLVLLNTDIFLKIYAAASCEIDKRLENFSNSEWQQIRPKVYPPKNNCESRAPNHHSDRIPSFLQQQR